MWWSLPAILAIVFLIYCLLPNYWARNHSPAVIRRGPYHVKYIALTFDDGPNPEYTPALLDILKKYQVPATFFLVGREASRYPELVRRMKDEGHAIGCHSWSHFHAWLMPPFMTYRDMYKTYQTLTGILGYPPRWYRPPWGTFNMLTINAVDKVKLRPAYWSIEAQDWEAKTTVEHIKQTILGQAKPGSIVVLHDNGGAHGAPKRTLSALPAVIENLQKQGYRFVTLDDMYAALQQNPSKNQCRKESYHA